MAVAKRQKSFECALSTEKAHIASTVKGSLSGIVGGGGWFDPSNRNVAIRIEAFTALATSCSSGPFRSRHDEPFRNQT